MDLENIYDTIRAQFNITQEILPEPFVLKTSPEINIEKFFQYLKNKNEKFGLIKVHKQNIQFALYDDILVFITQFFKNGMTGIQKHINAEDITNHDVTAPWQLNLETYCKYVWLTKEFFTKHGFLNPMGIHWNPNFNKFVIHPGGTRQMVHYYFGNDVETFLGFNTGGIEVDWVKLFSSEEELLAVYPDVILAICKDHNTMIPHPHFTNIDVYNNISAKIPDIIEFYKTTKINANFDYGEFGLIQPDTYTKEVTLTIEEDTLDNKIKAFFLLPNFDNFNGYGVHIEITRS